MTDTDMPEGGLLPCPFCGGRALLGCTGSPSAKRGWYPTCTTLNCPGVTDEQDEQGGTHFDHWTQAEAIAAWNTRAALNTRAPDPTPQEADAVYVVRRHGSFFRPNAAGYTNHLAAAGFYTKADAEGYLQADGVSVHHINEYREEAEATIAGAQRLAAALNKPTPQKPWCETCGKDVAEVLCPTCAKWWNDNLPPTPQDEGGLVERVARALSKNEHGDEGEWPLYVSDALAAIRAMQPTPLQEREAKRHQADCPLQHVDPMISSCACFL